MSPKSILSLQYVADRPWAWDISKDGFMGLPCEANDRRSYG